MALTTAITELCTRLKQMRDALSGLRLTVAEDKPLRGGDVALVDRQTDAIEDVLGLVDEGLDTAERGRRALRKAGDGDVVREGLVKCQSTFNAAMHRFYWDVASYDRVAEVAGLGRSRGGEWQSWAQSVKQALRRCEQPAYDATQALFACWLEVAERSGGGGPTVSVRTTTIGQQITRSVADAAEAASAVEASEG